MDYEQLVLAYKLSRHFTEEKEEGKRFCLLLHDGDAFTVDDIFASSLQYDHPVLECVSSWLSTKNTDKHLNLIVQKVNSCLKECSRDFQINCEDLKNHPFRNVGSETSSVPFEEKDRKKIYYKIEDNALVHTQYIAHFLLTYNEVFKIKSAHQKDRNMLHSVLTHWDWRTESERRTWNHLKSILLFLHCDKLVHEIEGKELKCSCPINIPSYLTHKDCNENIIIRLTSPITNITIKSHSENDVKTLENQSDYKEELSGDKLLIQVFKNDYFCPDKLEISSLDDPIVKIPIPIEDTPHRQSSKRDNIEIVTHGYEDILEFIRRIKNVEETTATVEYISNGGNHRTTLTRNEWYELCWEYVLTYFSLKDAKHIREAIQFPPYRKGNKISEFAYLLKNALMQTENVCVITTYNTEEHLTFLKYPTITKLGNYENRILIIFPNPIIFFNIRNTESTKLDDLEDEIMAGENDIKSLFVLNKCLLKGHKMIFFNIIAAPNLDDGENTFTCGKCHVMFKNDLKSVHKLKVWFNQILVPVCQDLEIRSESECSFMEVLSNIFGFLATRKSIRSRVPAIEAQPAEKIQSLMLNTEQMNILYSDEKKKIIVGGFGSGKSLLALYQIKDLVEWANEETEIFYICWDVCSMLVHDVRKFVETFPRNHLVTTHIFNIDDICENLNLTSVPSLSVLIKKLLLKYPKKVLHLSIDEFDGEQLNLEAAAELQETLQREELEVSYITVLPHSLSKKRTYVSKGKKQQHENYRYEETGMKIFQLSKCMRTTENIFKLTKAIERKICQESTVIYQPKQVKSKRVNVSKMEDSVSPKTPAVPHKTLTIPHATAETFHKSGEHSNFFELSKTNWSKEDTSVQTKDHSDNHEMVPRNQSLSMRSRILLERSIDIDVIAANISQFSVHKSKKTVTKYDYPKVSYVGHNIRGSIPKYVTITEQNPISAHSLSHLISKLSIILERWFSQNNTRKLVLCNAKSHYFVMKNVLKLLNIDFIEYIDYSGWQPNSKEGDIASPSQNKCILTNCAGSRGNEAEQVLVVIDPTATKLKHLTLECMTRCQNDLLIIGINESMKSEKKWLFEDILKWFNTEHSMGEILEEVKNDGLLEFNQWSCISLDDEEICVLKKKMQINVKSKTYREYIDVLKDMECAYEDLSHGINMDATALKQLQNTDSVKNLKCSYKDGEACSLAWKAEGFTYIVYAREMDFTSDCNERNLSIANILQLIRNNNIDELKKHLTDHPNIVHMRDDNGFTPLMLTAVYTNNSSMVKLLIEYGCDVWAEDKDRRNSYHHAAFYDRHAILRVLCQHEVTYINRRDVYNQTPLDEATHNCNISCVDALLRCDNIEVTITSNDGHNVYDVAERWENRQNREIIKAMIKNFKKSRNESKK